MLPSESQRPEGFPLVTSPVAPRIVPEGARTLILPPIDLDTKPILIPPALAPRFEIDIAPEVVARLTAEVWMAFKSVPRRGLEIGGVLLGTVDRGELTTRFRVLGYETVDCEHRFGPSYVLSDGDFARFRETLGKHPGECLGTYRSHTRSSELRPHKPDASLLRQTYGEADAVVMILGPSLSSAAFFVVTGGAFQCIREFPLQSAVSSVIAMKPQPAQVVRTEVAPVAAQASAEKKSSLKGWAIGLAAAGLTCLLGLGGWSLYSNTGSAAPVQTVAVSAPPAPVYSAPVEAKPAPVILPVSKPVVSKPVQSKPVVNSAPVAPPMPTRAPVVAVAPVMKQPEPLHAASVTPSEPVTPRHKAFVRVFTEPVATSRIGTLFGKIPFLHKTRKYVAPVAVHQELPPMTDATAKALVESVQLNVKVSIDANGKVTHAEITGLEAIPTAALQNAAIQAAKNWTFQPASSEDGGPVASEMVLHFQFASE